MFPKDPRATNEEYFGWLGYLSRATRAYREAATMIQRQDFFSIIDLNDLPRNFFVATAGGEQGRFLTKFKYISVNPNTGVRREYFLYHWLEEITTVGNIFEQVHEFTQNILNSISASVKAVERYHVEEGSLILQAIIRRF